MASEAKIVTPLTIVISALTIIEIAITVLSPRLDAVWEKVPVLIVIILLPLIVIGTFAFLWIKEAGTFISPF